MDERLLSFSHFKMDWRRVWEHRCQHAAKLVQLIKRDVDIVPRLIERHHVFVRVDDLFDVLVVVVSPS